MNFLLWSVSILGTSLLLSLSAAYGQTPETLGSKEDSAAKAGVAGTWQGTFHPSDGRELRLVLKIERNEKGELTGNLYSIDQNGQPPMPGSSVRYENGVLRFVNEYPGLTYRGRIAPGGASINGTIEQNGSSYPLILSRATADTAWPIPVQPSRLSAMEIGAKPDVEVATIKPSPADAPQTSLSFRGSELMIKRMSLADLVEFAWDLHEKQIIGEPAWMASDKWDIEAKPDKPGTPNPDQIRELVQKLLAERFGLKFHQERRGMSAYVLDMGSTATKMTKSADQLGKMSFSVGPGGLIRMRDASLKDFAAVLQRTTLDRPVIDHSGIEGRWDFTLQWLPDDSQFGGQLKPPLPDDSSASLPSIFTAVEEQLGLKLSSQKIDVPVMVIDLVGHPSPN